MKQLSIISEAKDYADCRIRIPNCVHIRVAALSDCRLFHHRIGEAKTGDGTFMPVGMVQYFDVFSGETYEIVLEGQANIEFGSSKAGEVL